MHVSICGKKQRTRDRKNLKKQAEEKSNNAMQWRW